MKKAWLLIFVLLSLAGICLAQNNQYTIQGSGDINKSMAPEQRFQYPSFTQGKVVFKDGREAVAQLNYNWVLGDMQFINANGDTLSLTNEATLKYITLANDSFFYDKQYLQLIEGNAKAKLAKNQKLKLGDVKKIGAFGTRTSGADVTTYSSVIANSSRYNLNANQELTVETKTAYYIGDAYNHFLPANKKNLLRIFSKNEATIEAYLQDNRINFNKEEDLHKLMAFLKDLGR